MESKNLSHLSPPPKFIFGIAVFALGVGIGAFVSFYFFSSSEYQAGFAAAQAVVENSSVGALFKTPDDVRSLRGTVISVEGNRITLRLIGVNPFADQSLNDRVMLVTANTKIVTLTQSAIITTKGTATVSAPSEESVDISAIIEGAVLSVVATENIKDLKEFAVYKILILPKTVAS